MNLIFAGTPDFAVASLKALQESSHRIIAVYTRPDRPVGRGRKLQPSPVKRFALDNRLTVVQPERLRDDPELDRLRALQPDLMVVVAYGMILPQAVLDIPRLGCVNVHASLLPRWRGAAPIQRAIEAGDAVTGVSIMQMNAGLDTGPVLQKAEIPIKEDDSAASLHDRLARLGAETLVATIDRLATGDAHPEMQDESLVTYADKLSKAEAEIDWRAAAATIGRRVRAFFPWPMANSYWKGKRLRILHTEIGPPTDVSPGQVVAASAGGIAVATGSGTLVIQRLQLEGRKPQTAGEFLNGHALRVGDRLGT